MGKGSSEWFERIDMPARGWNACARRKSSHRNYQKRRTSGSCCCLGKSRQGRHTLHGDTLFVGFRRSDLPESDPRHLLYSLARVLNSLRLLFFPDNLKLLNIYIYITYKARVLLLCINFIDRKSFRKGVLSFQTVLKLPSWSSRRSRRGKSSSTRQIQCPLVYAA